MDDMGNTKYAHFLVFLFSGCLVILMIGALFAPAPAHAEVLTFEGELNATTPIDLTGRQLGPGEELLLHGHGEAGQQVHIELLSGSETQETILTTVNQDGTWQASIPITTEFSANQLRLSSHFSSTPAERVTNTLALGTLAMVGIVLLELLLERLVRLLQAMGLLGKSQTRGYVFDVETKEPVAFALLTIESVAEDGRTDHHSDNPRLFETVVSTVDGFFRSVDLPAGKYRIHVAHPNYSFPPTGVRPWYVKPLELYQGGIFELKRARQLDVISIPMQPREKSNKPLRYWLNVRVFSTVIQHILHVLRGPMMIASLAFLLLSPSLMNFLFVSLYLFLFLFDVFSTLRTHQIKGKVLDEYDQPIPHAVIRIVQSPPEELAGVILTKKNGQFMKRLGKGQYRLSVSKDGYIPEETDRLSFEMLDLKESHAHLVYRLKKIDETSSMTTDLR